MTNEEAIKYLRKADDTVYREPKTRTAEALEMAIKALEDSRWIPVTERLPEENGRYLVTRGLKACGALWNRIYIANYSDLMGIKSERVWWQGNVVDDVIAWMPLPNRYEEGAEDEKRNCNPRD